MSTAGNSVPGGIRHSIEDIVRGSAVTKYCIAGVWQGYIDVGGGVGELSVAEQN